MTKRTRISGGWYCWLIPTCKPAPLPAWLTHPSPSKKKAKWSKRLFKPSKLGQSPSPVSIHVRSCSTSARSCPRSRPSLAGQELSLRQSRNSDDGKEGKSSACAESLSRPCQKLSRVLVSGVSLTPRNPFHCSAEPCNCTCFNSPKRTRTMSS